MSEENKNMKYFQLNKELVLREWANGVCGLVNTQTGEFIPASKVAILALQIADGSIANNSILISRAYKQVLDEVVKYNLGQYYDEPQAKIAKQKLRKTKARKINSVHWSITGKCNLKCRHCFVDAPTAEYGELSYEQMILLLDQMVEANVSAISITGGEPFIFKKWYELFSEIRKRDIAITMIFTNGEVLTKQLLDKIDSLNIKPDFYLSYDGTNGCHDWVRNKIGINQRTIEAVKLLKSRGFRVCIETAIYKDNIAELIPTYELLRDLDIDLWKLSAMVNNGAWQQYSDNYSPNKDDMYEKYLNLIDKFNDDGKPFALQLGGVYYGTPTSSGIPFDKSTNNKSKLACDCAYSNPYLLPNGRVMPCIPMASTNLEEKMPNLLVTPLSDVLSDSKLNEVSGLTLKDLSDNSSCGKCDFWNNCKGGCRACAVTESGSLYGKDVEACHFWKNSYFNKFNQRV